MVGYAYPSSNAELRAITVQDVANRLECLSARLPETYLAEKIQ